VTDLGWIDGVLTSARPQVMGALLRYFRDLDTAEEAFQEACPARSGPGRRTARRATPRRG
jgi:predicted RNA polymerase sigma factor